MTEEESVNNGGRECVMEGGWKGDMEGGCDNLHSLMELMLLRVFIVSSCCIHECVISCFRPYISACVYYYEDFLCYSLSERV